MSERDARDLIVRLDGQAALDRLDERRRRQSRARWAMIDAYLAAKHSARWDGETLVPLEECQR